VHQPGADAVEAVENVALLVAWNADSLIDHRDDDPVAVTAQGDDVTIHITDKLSTIGKVEYSADAQKWIRLTPVDGIADSNEEMYKLKRSAIDGKFVVVRATDASYNVATVSIALP